MKPAVQSAVLIDLDTPLVREGLRTPRAAAIAGMLFSILMTTSLWILRVSIPADPQEIETWLSTSSERISFALNLVPFAGVSFMWFLGVLRDRLGAKEDKFFATVFLGSGLMFLGMIFVAASAIGGIVLAYATVPKALFQGSSFVFARVFAYDLLHIYAFKMAAVFMITTSTLARRTRVTARWIPLLGYAAAACLIFGSGYLDWVLFIFPCWVFLLSAHILSDNLRRPPRAAANRDQSSARREPAPHLGGGPK